MNKLTTKLTKWIFLLLLEVGCINVNGQETIFGLFKNEASLGDQYYEDKNYQSALTLYLSAARKNRTTNENQLRVARCYYSLKQYQRSIDYYNQYLTVKRTLPWSDLYNYAEALAITADYGKAIESYRKYLAKDPRDEMILKKIWRLNNIQYLYEDSAQFDVKPISLNTDFGELCPVYFQNGIVFLSNRKDIQVVEKVNASLDAPFYKIYYSRFIGDASITQDLSYNSALPFDKEFITRYNAGPVAFYDGDQKMVFVSTGNEASANGTRTLQLFFAEKIDGEWKVNGAFPYNNVQYSISDPSISKDGTRLYFSSDMGGGFGGRDLYQSHFVNGKWTRPVNLGETINTAKDEAFPHAHMEHTLYFASNGHPGMGGFDIFKAAIRADGGFGEPQNTGYPINTSYDDFGIVVDSEERHGYFSSNRKNGGYNDDIYSVDMYLQTFPITVSCVLKYKEITWGDSLALQIMPNAKISVIDNVRNVVVQESISDVNGNFTIVIPYFSKYVIRVKEEDDNEYMAVLEIPKRRRELSAHEIVIVKDIFKKNENTIK